METKPRILYLKKILEERTDEEHPLSTTQLINILNDEYHQVYSYTGYELDKLEEKNGTYYTESGENILDLVDSAVESSGKVPKEFKQQMNNWIHDLVSTISTRGWNNVPDMTLSIIYGKSSLKDMNQLITYQYEADRMNRQWYSVL